MLVGCLLLLASCGLFEGEITLPIPISTRPQVTTAPPPAPEQSEAAAYLEALSEAEPTGAMLEISASYREPAVTLTAEVLCLHGEESDYYSYRIDRLLSVEEALLAGSPIKTDSGHLTLAEGGLVTDSPAEVTDELLSGLSSLSLRLPTLEEALFTECMLERNGDAVTLGGIVSAEYITHLLGEDGEEVTALTVAVTVDDATRLPTALRMRWLTPGGATVEMSVTYSYEEIAIPD